MGLWYVSATPLVSVAVCVPIPFAGGFTVAGWLWSVLFATGGMLLLCDMATQKEIRVRLPAGPWLVWFGFVWTSLLWCEAPGRPNVQQAVQFSMPLLVGALASIFVRSEDHLRRVVRSYYWSLPLLGLIIIATRLEIIHTETGGNRDAALTVALVGCVCLAGIESRAWIALIGWVGCIVLILLSASRTAAVALLSVVVLHPLYRGMGHRLLAILGIAACGLALFYSPIIQQRMFHSGSGSIRDLLAGNDVDTSGRFEAWPVIWEEAWKRPLLGAGVGTASPFVQRIWPGVSHPHNDYVRIGFEQGLIGLTIFVSVVGWQLLDLLRGSAVSTDLARQTFVASFLGLLALTITCITDNTLVYNLSYTDPLFALMGAAYGFHLGDGEPWRRRW